MPQNVRVTGGENGYAFDVALSFAGEDRAYVDGVAERLRDRGVRVFYDRYAVVDTWGVDLVELFDEVFRSKARFAVVFVSESYVAKPWPTHERRSAQARALVELGPYLLPVRLDDAELPGLRPTVGYVDARHLTQDSLTDLICEKVAATRAAAAPRPKPAPPPPPPPPAYAPAPAAGYWPYAAPAWPWARPLPGRTVRTALRHSWHVVLWIALASLVPGMIFATYTFKLTEESFPAGRALEWVVQIALVMGLAAVLVSWLYDVVSWRQKADDFALLDWPWWHRIAVGAAAVAAPALVVVLHRSAVEAAEARLPVGEVGFYPWDPAWPYGPPPYFWWIAPSAMLAAHVLCLAFRYLRRLRASR
jgi:hypothetical protein